MSNERNDGGPAFPRTAADPEWGGGTESFEGMTLRDYFAAKAMQGYCSNIDWANLEDAAIAENAYNLADAMLEARK